MLAHDNCTWDANQLAQLAAEMAARNVIFGIGENFVSYPSKYADIPGSPLISVPAPNGEPKDYAGELADAVRARGMRFGIYRGYRLPERNRYWMETMKEIIDRYQPAKIMFDDETLSYPAEELRSKEFLAYYYNHSAKPEEAACEDALGSHKQDTWGRYVPDDEGGPRPADGIPWRHLEEGLTIEVPYSGPATTAGGVNYANPKQSWCRIVIPCDHAFVVKITPKPDWVE